jgi:hypothetical protein
VFIRKQSIEVDNIHVQQNKKVGSFLKIQRAAKERKKRDIQ